MLIPGGILISVRNGTKRTVFTKGKQLQPSADHILPTQTASAHLCIGPSQESVHPSSARSHSRNQTQRGPQPGGIALAGALSQSQMQNKTQVCTGKRLTGSAAGLLKNEVFLLNRITKAGRITANSMAPALPRSPVSPQLITRRHFPFTYILLACFILFNSYFFFFF